LRTCSNSKPTVDTAYPRAQKCSPVKFRSLPHKRAIAMALFPFRNPITKATGYFGGIAMHILLFLALTKPRGMLCPNGTVKPFLVSLVEPVAYLKSELSFPGSRFGGPLHLSENLIFAKNQVLFIFNLDFGAAELPEEDAITDFHIHGNSLAFLQFACANGYDLPLLRFFFSRIGHDDATLHGLLLLDTLDHE